MIPLYRHFMKPLGALYMHTYAHFSLFATDTQLSLKNLRKYLEYTVVCEFYMKGVCQKIIAQKSTF